MSGRPRTDLVWALALIVAGAVLVMPADLPGFGEGQSVDGGPGGLRLHFLAAGLALAAILLGAEGLRRWRQSTLSKILRAYAKLDAVSPGTAIKTLWTDYSHYPGRRERRLFILGLAKRLELSSDALRQALAPMVRMSAIFGGELAKIRNQQFDSAERHQGSMVLLERAEMLDRFAESEIAIPSFLRLLALQDRIFATIYQASSLPHLGSMADQVELYLEQIRDEAPTLALMDLVAATLLAKVTQLHSQLARLPPEDRALVLGRSLSEVVLGIEEVRSTRRGNAWGLVTLEMLRQILIGALRDLRQRAEIHLDLKTRILPSRRDALVVLDLSNTGQGHASNIDIHLKDSPGVRVLTRSVHLPSLLKQQTARVEFLIEHQRGDRIRLTFLLRWDDLEMTGHQAEYADIVELRRPERAPTFRPLRPNPYVVGRPLRESDVFIGRDETFQRIAASLEGANQDNVVVLIGQRRMGKTSVLRQLRNRLSPGYVSVLVDLQGTLGRGESAFLRDIATAICDGLEAYGLEIEAPSSSSFSEDPGWYFRHQFLKPVIRKLGEQRLLIAFDEFEVLAERISAGELPPRILPYFRSLMQHENQVSFLFAGTHRLDQLTGDYWGALFNLAVYLEIGHLHEEEVKELFLRPTREFFELDPLALDKAIRATGGHPHFSQLVARELVEQRNEEILDYVTIQDLNRVARRVIQKGQLHIAYLWDEASLDERLLLLAVDELLSVEGGANLAMARELIESRGKDLQTCDLALALRILLRKELLSESSGRIEMRIELLRQWMEQNRSMVAETWV